MNTDLNKRLNLSLFLLRVGIFIVVGMWTLNKFVNPERTAAILNLFYSYEGLAANMSYAIGSVEVIVLLAFITGFQRTFFYWIMIVMHSASTLVAFGLYLNPWAGQNLLFFAAWPMLAALITLFILREYDGWTIDGMAKNKAKN